ncbi:hypothetical protein MTR_4g064953 [Medicago truncatula]|uniref:Uncharacterized protein n=1 Tax=Medicago truncatula TaxID=3880 RepID=A0A072UKC0_MEDTR|nr:hypothetical protein MTR_4g064953 [Medicago truncatula]
MKLTKIVIVRVLERRHMKLCMDGSVRHIYVSIMMVEYVDRPLEFEQEDRLFLHITPTTEVGKKLKPRKLTPKFLGS